MFSRQDKIGKLFRFQKATAANFPLTTFRNILTLNEIIFTSRIKNIGHKERSERHAVHDFDC